MNSTEFEAVIQELLAKVPPVLKAQIEYLRPILVHSGTVQPRAERRKVTTYRIRFHVHGDDGMQEHRSLTIGDDPALAHIVAVLLKGMKSHRKLVARETAKKARIMRDRLRFYRRCCLGTLRVGRRVRRRAALNYDRATAVRSLLGAYEMTVKAPAYEAQSCPGRPPGTRYW